MDVRLLRAFCVVAEQSSLTRAAAALGETSSTLSRRIASLERELRGRLFHRTGRGVVLTELGKRLAPRAEAAIASFEALASEASGERGSVSGPVDLAVVPGMSRPLVSKLCAWLVETHPQIRLRAVEAYSGQVEEWLALGRIDIGIFNRYGLGRVRDADLLLRSDVMLVTARGRQALPRGEVAFRLLRDLPLVLPPRPNALVARLGDIAARQGFALRFAFELGSSALIRDAVLRAGVATLVPDQVAARDYPASQFDVRRIVKPSLRQKAWLALTTQRPSSSAARLVAQAMRRFVPPEAGVL
ncbi:MAG: LysR family transcriptional regulator [Caldimonas sp.]|nr:LysR family transcriptional regulator [Pseudomonadota bacterium]